MKKKLKGFTLLELVVVIAIIAVLSSVLIPSASQYIRDSKIKTANNNAEIIYRAAQDWLIEQEIDNRKLFSTINPSTAYMRHTPAKQSFGKGKIETGTGMEGIDFDINQYISNNISIDGSWCVIVDSQNYEVQYVVYVEKDTTGVTDDAVSNNTYFFDNSNKQEEYSKETGIFVGVYPFKDNT